MKIYISISIYMHKKRKYLAEVYHGISGVAAMVSFFRLHQPASYMGNGWSGSFFTVLCSRFPNLSNKNIV